MSSVDERYRVSDGSLTGADAAVNEEFEPAGRGRRFANYVIDLISQILLVAVVTVIATLIWGEAVIGWLETVPDIVLGASMFLLYYVPTEGLTGRTLGKLITRTRVVDEAGGPPSLKQILGRTLARIIPFEAFSFLGATARGWHDSLSKTRVVVRIK